MIGQKEEITPIVPSVPRYIDLPGSRKLDYQAICCFAATGFFLEDDTYFTNRKALRPASRYRFDEVGNVELHEKYFHWHYTPREISFGQALDEFSHLIEGIVQKDTAGKKVILPISGGLDSRTLAAVLSGSRDVFSYSYEFENGVNENFYGGAVAYASGFDFQPYVIPNGYLWNVIDTLVSITGSTAEFTNPRQMAIWQQMNHKGDLFLLGHGGDLFFDGMGVPDTMSADDQLAHLVKKLVKPAGWELGLQLWKAWGVHGDFKAHLISRIKGMLESIPIDNANARLRAFKTENYVARWTAVNLELFQRQKPLSLPFFDDAMCRFICTIPESHLAGRRLEIEYIKRRAPALAKIPWQKVYPCNLYTYEAFKSPPVLIRRALIKGKRLAKEAMLGRRTTTRNWELQFLGEENDGHLKKYLFDPDITGFIPRALIDQFYTSFRLGPVAFVHCITMLLTLSLFAKRILH